MSTLKSRLKKRVKGVLRAWFAPKIYDSDIRQALEVLQVPKGKPVLVHSSLSAFGFVPGGPKAILSGIQSYLTPDSDIVLPTHSWNLVSRGSRTFNALDTPSCVGVITEWFRRQPGVIRSLHPTHSIAVLGPLAMSLVEGHENALTPCGPGSPYARLLEMDVSILFLGAPLEANTSYHCCEGLAGVPYLLQDEKPEFELIDQYGVQVFKKIPLHKAKVPRNLQPMNKRLMELGFLKQTKFAKTKISCIRGGAFREFLCNELLVNPNYLLA